MTFKLELDIPNIDAEQAEEILIAVSTILSDMGKHGIGGMFLQKAEDEE